jgi:hypothetical protein
MMQAREESGLAFNCFRKRSSANNVSLARRGVETLIDGLVNRTHPALPELAHDAIATL